MSINIANEQDLNRYISLEVAAQDLTDRFRHFDTAQHLHLEMAARKKMLAEYMAIRYLQDRLRQHWQGQTKRPFLKKLSKENIVTRELPGWVLSAINNKETVYIFDGTQLPMEEQHEIRRVGLFLTAMAEEYVERAIKFSTETGRPLKIYLDYLKGKHDYHSYDKALQETIKWEQNELKQQQKHAKIKRIMDLPNGYYAVELLNTAAMQLEGRKMANCLCDELQPYINDVKKEHPLLTIYSIRNQQGTPRVDITVRREEKIISDCAAKANDFVHPEDVPMVAAFVNALGMPMRIMAMRHARLLENEGRYYDVFNLPHDLRFHDSCLDLEGLNLKRLPYLENVVISGSFMCAHNQLKNLKGAPRKIHGAFSFYDNPIESFEGFPTSVGSVVTPIELDQTSKQFVRGEITIIPRRISNLVQSNLMLDPYVFPRIRE